MNKLIPGLEKELTGKNEGDHLQVIVPPEKAYGKPNPDLIQKLPHHVFKEVGKVQPGMQLQPSAADVSVRLLLVQEVDDQGVTVNANHPLTGQTLHFDVRIESVRDVAPEEISHSHAH